MEKKNNKKSLKYVAVQSTTFFKLKSQEEFCITPIFFFNEVERKIY